MKNISERGHVCNSYWAALEYYEAKVDIGSELPETAIRLTAFIYGLSDALQMIDLIQKKRGELVGYDIDECTELDPAVHSENKLREQLRGYIH